jgi:hypothetical protein
MTYASESLGAWVLVSEGRGCMVYAIKYRHRLNQDGTADSILA